MEYSILEKIKFYNREQSYLKNEIEKLKAENGKIKLIVSSMLRKSIEKSVFTQKEIETLCKQIDAEDGQIDGQYHGEVLTKKV